MNEILGIHHASVIVGDTAVALNFYVNVLGLAVDKDRPAMSYDGAWLIAGTQQIHLLELPNPDPVSGRPEHAGRDRHIALSVRNLDSIVTRLKNAAIPFSMSRSGRKAVFFRDPDGNGIELIEQL